MPKQKKIFVFHLYTYEIFMSENSQRTAYVHSLRRMFFVVHTLIISASKIDWMFRFSFFEKMIKVFIS